MRAAILSDIHSNLEALTAVLADARGHAADTIWCLGDIVGYGPDPAPCVDAFLGLSGMVVAGNHDLAAVGKVSLADFNPYAAATFRWTAAQLSKEQVTYLSGLPLRMEHHPLTLVHGSPRDPIWEYLLSTEAAQACFNQFTTPYCLVGHSHIPFVHRQGERPIRLARATPGIGVSLGDERLIINPGSVGQPRDGDPRASYIIYDEERKTLEFQRVLYDFPTTQRKILQAGLPPFLAERLQQGR